MDYLLNKNLNGNLFNEIHDIRLNDASFLVRLYFFLRYLQINMFYSFITAFFAFLIFVVVIGVSDFLFMFMGFRFYFLDIDY